MTTVTEERRKEWDCWDIHNGCRGDHKVAMHHGANLTAEEAAVQAAKYFDDTYMRGNQISEADLHGGYRFIEVETAGGPRQYSVLCLFKRVYSAMPVAATGRRG